MRAVLGVDDKLVLFGGMRFAGVSVGPDECSAVVGLGVDAMSVSPRMFLRVKQTIRGLKHEAMKKLVAKALACSESDEVRLLLEQNP